MSVSEVARPGNLVSEPNEQPRRRSPRSAVSKRWTEQDLWMINAARNKTPLIVTLAVETDFTGEDYTFKGNVLRVDIYSYLFSIEGREVWIGKPFVVSVESRDDKE